MVIKTIKFTIFLLLAWSFLFSVTIMAADEESEEQMQTNRANPEDFDAVEPLEDPRQILKNFPAFTVDKRTDFLEEEASYPCTDCHDNDEQKSNPKIRVLEEDHEAVNLVHGKGRFWCLNCHSANDRDSLISLNQQGISFDDSYLLCGQCHFQRQKDFFYGAHGKRKGMWKGERKLTNCTECHNPHVPQIISRLPVAKPKVRTGLNPMKIVTH